MNCNYMIDGSSVLLVEKVVDPIPWIIGIESENSAAQIISINLWLPKICIFTLQRAEEMLGRLGSRNSRYALAKSILFFEGQRSGQLPPSQRVTWRREFNVFMISPPLAPSSPTPDYIKLDAASSFATSDKLHSGPG